MNINNFVMVKDNVICMGGYSLKIQMEKYFIDIEKLDGLNLFFVVKKIHKETFFC